MNNRIIAQQSVFAFGEGKIEKGEYKEMEIDADSKLEIVATLETHSLECGRQTPMWTLRLRTSFPWVYYRNNKIMRI